jgi:hypothetical protein
MTISSFRAFAVMMMTYYASNTPMLHQAESEEYDSTSQTTLAVGRPAELLNNRSIKTDVIENVGHPDEVFIHSAGIARHLDCSLETARNVLQQFEQAGIIKKHGGIDVDADYATKHLNIYLPSFDDPKSVMKELYQMEGETPPSFIIATEEVTPRQFIQVEPSQLDDQKIEELEIKSGDSGDSGDSGLSAFDVDKKPIENQSLFQYTENESVIIDVSKPKNGSIQDHISDQLLEHGLAASSLKNFAYELRQEAGLV